MLLLEDGFVRQSHDVIRVICSRGGGGVWHAKSSTAREDDFGSFDYEELRVSTSAGLAGSGCIYAAAGRYMRAITRTMCERALGAMNSE